MSKMSNVHHGSKNNAVEMIRVCFGDEMEHYKDRKDVIFVSNILIGKYCKEL